MTREEKDELIELSDLNREDNIEYISSEAQGIAIILDSDKYAPTLCKLERAYICGRRKSEKENKRLEAQIEQIKCCENCNWWYRLPSGQKDCAETHCEKLSHWAMRIKE